MNNSNSKREAKPVHKPNHLKSKFEIYVQKLQSDQRFRFLVVGGFNTVFGFFNFVWIQALFGHKISYMGSFLMSYVLTFTVAFVLHRKVVFKVSGHVWKDLIRFQSVYLIPLTINLVVLPLLVTGVKVNVYVAQALAVTFNTLVSYVGHKYVSFRRPKAK
jgi:putative flippase GtrA